MRRAAGGRDVAPIDRPARPVGPGAGGGAPGEVAALPAAAARWVSADAVRQAIGAWAYARPAGGSRAGAAPDGATVRAAVAVASALCELAADPAWTRWADSAVAEQGRSSAASAPAGARQAASGWLPLAPVPRDVGALADRSGVEPRAVERALALLERAGVVHRTDATGDPRVTLGEATLSPAPVLAAVHWRDVRRRLADTGAPVAAPLAVLREVAADAGPSAEGAIGAPVRLSVRMLEERTGYGRSTVAEAIAALAAARVVDVEARPGRTARFALRPAAFGRRDEPVAAARSVVAPGARGGEMGGGGATPPSPAPAPPPAPTSAPAPAGPTEAIRGAGTAAATIHAPPGTTPAEPAQPATPLPMAGGAVFLGTFAGTPIHGPPGTPLVVECDAAGRWTCRVGPFLTLGPVGPVGGSA